MKLGKHKTLRNHRVFISNLNNECERYKFQGYVCAKSGEEILATAWDEEGNCIDGEKWKLKLWDHAKEKEEANTDRQGV